MLPNTLSSGSRERNDSQAGANPHAASGNPSPGRLPSELDVEILQETKNQIRGLVQEITALVEAGGDASPFFAGFLPRVVAALAAEGGAIWLRNERQELEQRYQMQWSQSIWARDNVAAERHMRLLQQSLAATTPQAIPPQSGGGSGAANASDHLLLLGVLRVDQQPVGLVEILQRPGASPTTERGYIRFLDQVCELGSRFLRNQRLENLAAKQSTWHRQDQFVRAIHRTLDRRGTLFAVANEGRRLIGCDRVSVAWRRGARSEILVSSGLDSVDRRAEQVKALEQLASAVVRRGEPIWLDPAAANWPSGLESVARNYQQLTHARGLAILPLALEPGSGDAPAPAVGSAAGASEPRREPPFAALICEQFQGNGFAVGVREQIAWVATHSAAALTSADRHSRIFLLPLWESLGGFSGRVLTGRIARVSLLLVVMSLCAAALAWTPASFDLAAKGALVPQTRHEIFAPIDGTLDELFLPENPEALVEANQLLARLSNNDLLVAIEDLEGQQRQWSTRHQNLTHSWGEQKNSIDKLQVERDLAEATAMLESLQRQLDIKRRELSLLEIRAPVRGHIINWQLEQTLLRRPVRTGQSLMTVVAPETDWQVELELPERRVAHFLRAAAASAAPLEVRFTLASLPGRELRGTVVDWDRCLEVRSDQGNCLRVRIAFDKLAVPEELLKTGTRATAQVECGQRSLGYVWFRELIETAQATWWMWF